VDFKDYEEFWVYYLTQHLKPATRSWHFVGTSLVFLFIILAISFMKWWILLLAPLSAYGIAWISHFFIEGNKPATFGHPVWSLRADFRMYWFTLTRQLERELARTARFEKKEKNG
jgi:hypothetical protein